MELNTGLGIELQAEFAQLRQDIRASRIELLRWWALLWVLQVISIVGLIGAMLRAFGLR